MIYLHFIVTGHLITVDSAFSLDQEQAVLVSPVLDQPDWGCVRLVYQITGRGSLHLHLRPDGDNFDYRLWAANKTSDSWLIASVDLPNTTNPYQVGMAVRPWSQFGFLDEITVRSDLICCIVKFVQDIVGQAGIGSNSPQLFTLSSLQ